MRVKKVEYVDGYRLKISFSDKKVKIVDLEEKMKNAKGIFRQLKDLEYFKKVTIDDSELSICWPNGEDICPDVLYSMGVGLKVKKSGKKPMGREVPCKVRRTKAAQRNRKKRREKSKEIVLK